MTFPPPLWGGVVDNIEIDLATQKVSMGLHVNDSRQSPPVQTHKLEFIGVSEFRWFNSIPGPWNYAELSEIYINQSEDGRRLVEIVFWSSDAGMSISAESVLLDGREVNAKYLSAT